MTGLAKSVEVTVRSNRIRVDFLKLDVQLGLTFSGMALKTQDSEKRARTRRLGRKAYDTVLRLMDRVALTKEDDQSLALNLYRLKCDLVMLGEIF